MMSLHDLKFSHSVAIGLAFWFVYGIFYVGRAIYRTHFHPLKSFPGLPEAKLSQRWLYRVTRDGHPNQTFEDLHDKNNSHAIRIAPNELHITDVSLYKVIYGQSNPFPKCPDFYSAFNIPHSLLTETDPKAHKARRQMLNSLFSRVGVLKLESLIQKKLRSLGQKFDRLQSSDSIDIYDAFRLLTTEIILEFAFARPADLIGEDPNGFRSWFLDAFDLASQSIIELQHSLFLRIFAKSMPRWIVKIFSKEAEKLLDMNQYAESSLNFFKERSELPDHPVVFESLKTLPDRLCIDEAQDIMVAGADTTAFTLTTGTFHILSDPSIYKKLIAVLGDSIPRDEEFPSLMTLEKIPYLTAIVKESLRIASAVPGRLPRRVPEGRREPFVVDGKVIPPGTIVSITAYTMHTSTDIWGPDARTFDPGRWLKPDAKQLDQYLCSFSKGTRMCLGQNVATAELTIAFAWLFRNYHLSLPEGFSLPPNVDRFTNTYLKPGVKANIMRRLQ